MIGSIAATAHFDLKKILAYSTVSNCGYMMLFALTATKEHTLLFFMTHGLLKGMAFIFISFIIIELNHRQDLRFAKGLGYLKPFLGTGVFFTVMGLGALPLSTMLFIKHEALFRTTLSPINETLMTYILTLSALTTTIYSIRLVGLTFYFGVLREKLLPKDYIIKRQHMFNGVRTIIAFSSFHLVLPIVWLTYMFIGYESLGFWYYDSCIDLSKPTVRVLTKD